MSDGFVHKNSSLVLAASFGVGALISQNPSLLVCAGGALVGILVGCDLDVDKGNISNFIIRKRMGNFAERIWRWFWKGYSGSFKHRGFASHFPVFSTFVRLSYIYFWVILLPHVVFKLIFSPPWSLSYVLEWYALAFLNPLFFYGLCSSDLVHFALDFLIVKKVGSRTSNLFLSYKVSTLIFFSSWYNKITRKEMRGRNA